ncbi:MAG: hypothetical protein K8R18_11950 [Parvibaculum sp.]|uniref:sensor histidine kinase n=1 Tax=Parvibaculum sp. TaxID=2024848 RepID=UPI0025D7EDF0|nr:ATP-binding protein [Parvibaculum sp.]MCE9650325.1 hypothetical protein [Parvibaculum sp.]
MRVMETSGRRAAEPATRLPLSDALLDFSFMLAAASGPADLRAALKAGVALLANAEGETHLAICEISAAPDGRPLIAWQMAAGGPEIEEKTAFNGWFRRARASPGFFERCDGDACWGVLSPQNGASGWESFTGLVVAGAEPEGERLKNLSAVARFAAAALARVERGASEESARRRLASVNEEALAWLEFGADVVWEANADGVMRCRRVLNRRVDLARAIEGANLRALTVGAGERSLFELLQVEPQVRHLRGRFNEGAPASFFTDNALYVSAMLRESDFSGPPTYVGTLTCASSRTASRFLDDTSTTLARMRTSRDREERHRIEDDAMLEGLRLLLDSRSPREKLSRLTTLLCENVGGEEALIVEPGYDGRPRLLLPEQKTLDLSAGSVVNDIAEATAATRMKLYEEDDPVALRLREALGLTAGSIAAFALPLRVQSAYLLCATGPAKSLSPSGLIFAERFAFILRQALLLREEQAQLAQTAKMAALGQMSASIAHELKQPLNTISLATQNLEALLSSPKFDSAAVEVKIARVLAQVDRAANVIDRMRRFGRKSLGESASVPVEGLIEGVLMMIRHVLDRAGVDVELDLGQKLTIRGDELQLEQVLTNLVQNAVDAISGVGSRVQPGEMGKGKIRIAAFVSPDEAGEVVLRIEDNGPGFPPGVAERVLEPFFTTKPAEQGTGLGLAICDAIVREGGGRLVLGNHEGGGFVALTMPAALAASIVPSEIR